MPGKSSFDYAVIRVVPRVERGEFVNVGVVLLSREKAFLGCRIELDRERLLWLHPGVDVAAVEQHLASFRAICEGTAMVTELATLGERFHHLTSPRSTVVQTSPVHSGISDDPAAELEHLTEDLVRPPGRR